MGFGQANVACLSQFVSSYPWDRLPPLRLAASIEPAIQVSFAAGGWLLGLGRCLSFRMSYAEEQWLSGQHSVPAPRAASS